MAQRSRIYLLNVCSICTPLTNTTYLSFLIVFLPPSSVRRLLLPHDKPAQRERVEREGRKVT